MTKKLETEVNVSDMEVVEVHQDAGGSGHSMNCPNCQNVVIFAPNQWWSSSCKCGDWDLDMKAVLETDDTEFDYKKLLMSILYLAAEESGIDVDKGIYVDLTMEEINEVGRIEKLITGK